MSFRLPPTTVISCATYPCHFQCHLVPVISRTTLPPSYEHRPTPMISIATPPLSFRVPPTLVISSEARNLYLGKPNQLCQKACMIIHCTGKDFSVAALLRNDKAVVILSATLPPSYECHLTPVIPIATPTLSFRAKREIFT